MPSFEPSGIAPRTSDLYQLAWDVREHFYAPYSGYAVGAAIETASGATFVGTNFENVSFGATICAERSAVAAMIAAGERTIVRLALATEDGATPCGICLQVLREFMTEPDQVEVVILSKIHEPRMVRFSELLPAPFVTYSRTDRAL